MIKLGRTENRGLTKGRRAPNVPLPWTCHFCARGRTCEGTRSRKVLRLSPPKNVAAEVACLRKAARLVPLGSSVGRADDDRDQGLLARCNNSASA